MSAAAMTTRATLPRGGTADRLLALALLLPSLVQVIAAPIASRPVGVVVALGSTVPIAWRRRWPLAAAAVGAAVWMIPTHGYLYLGYVAGFILFYSAAAFEPLAQRVVALVAFGLIASTVAAAEQAAVAGEYFGAITAVLAPAAVGRLVRRQREQARRLTELTEHLERERERGARAAVMEERTRVARELHDVVAHGVSVIAIHSDAAEAALARDPDLARAPLRTIRASAGEALVEMRRLLGALRDDGAPADLEPQPGLADLDELIAAARGTGMKVALEREGTDQPLPASVDLSAYRIVQEALTNARKHAPGARVKVHVRQQPRAIELTVENSPAPNGQGVAHTPTSGGGHGLVGMRERTRVHGGELQAALTPDGGYRVYARLPVQEPGA